MVEKSESLKTQIRNCKLCPLNEITPCRPVPGVGKKNAKAFFVSPRITYDQACIEVPFGDDDADYVKHLMERAKLNYKDYYYTTVVKCADSDHKYKKDEFASVCKNWLFKEIEENKPDYVFCMGKEVLCELLDCAVKSWKLSNVAGNTYEQNGITYVPMYSIAFLKEYGIKHTQKMADILNGFLKE